MRYLSERVANGMFAICLFAACAGALSAGPLAYVGYGGGTFGTIDLTTGGVTPIGSLGQTPAGLGVFNGALYAESYNATGTLYSVDTSSGALTAIGNSNVFFAGGFGSTLTGLYGVGYASGGSTLDVFSIDAANGSATDLGSTGLGLGSWRDISTNSSTLYFGDGADLYSLNVTNGSASLIGPFGGSAEMGSLVTIGSTLYGADDVSDLIDTINIASGTATAGPSAGGSVWGLAPAPLPTPTSAPEPATWSVLAVTLGLLLYSGASRFRRAL